MGRIELLVEQAKNFEITWQNHPKRIKDIVEELAADNIKDAYRECLKYQGKYAMTEEVYFEVYSSLYVIIFLRAVKISN